MSAPSTDPVASALSAIIVDNRKAEYKTRIDALVSSGRLTPAARKAHLDPLVDGFELSLDPVTHKPQTSSLDTILAVLESQAASGARLTGAPLTVQKTRKSARVGGFQGSQPTEEMLDPALLREPTGLTPIEDEDEFNKSCDQQIKQAGFRT